MFLEGNKGLVEVTGGKVKGSAGLAMALKCPVKLYGPKAYTDKLSLLVIMTLLLLKNNNNYYYYPFRSQKSVILHTFQPSVTRTPSAPGRPPAANL